MLKPDVEKAIAELKNEFGDTAVSYEEDGSGGAYTVIEPVALCSPPYNTPTWVAFHIPYTYPYADIYPVYVRNDLRQDGQRKEAMSDYPNYRGRHATQLSRRTQRYARNPDFDTAAAKIQKVLQWLKEVA